jgi:hypothetical protein
MMSTASADVSAGLGAPGLENLAAAASDVTFASLQGLPTSVVSSALKPVEVARNHIPAG